MATRYGVLKLLEGSPWTSLNRAKAPPSRSLFPSGERGAFCCRAKVRSLDRDSGGAHVLTHAPDQIGPVGKEDRAEPDQARSVLPPRQMKPMQAKMTLIIPQIWPARVTDNIATHPRRMTSLRRPRASLCGRELSALQNHPSSSTDSGKAEKKPARSIHCVSLDAASFPRIPRRAGIQSARRQQTVRLSPPRGIS